MGKLLLLYGMVYLYSGSGAPLGELCRTATVRGGIHGKETVSLDVDSGHVDTVSPCIKTSGISAARDGVMTDLLPATQSDHPDAKHLIFEFHYSWGRTAPPKNWWMHVLLLELDALPLFSHGKYYFDECRYERLQKKRHFRTLVFY